MKRMSKCNRIAHTHFTWWIEWVWTMNLVSIAHLICILMRSCWPKNFQHTTTQLLWHNLTFVLFWFSLGYWIFWSQTFEAHSLTHRHMLLWVKNLWIVNDSNLWDVKKPCQCKPFSFSISYWNIHSQCHFWGHFIRFVNVCSYFCQLFSLSIRIKCEFNWNCEKIKHCNLWAFCSFQKMLNCCFFFFISAMPFFPLTESRENKTFLVIFLFHTPACRQ